MNQGKPARYEFRIVVNEEDNGWVATSLLTATTAVAETMEQALGEVCELLVGEIRDATEATGNTAEAIRRISCPPAEELLRD